MMILKTLPLILRVASIAFLSVYLGTLAFSSYLSTFARESIANKLSDKVGHIVNFDSIIFRLGSGIKLKVRGFKISANHGEKKLFTAEEISAVIAYIPLFSGKVDIKESYVYLPQAYITDRVSNEANIFSNFNLKKVLGDIPRQTIPVVPQNKVSHSLGKVLLTGNTNPIPTFIASNIPHKETPHDRLVKKIKTILGKSKVSLNSIKFIKARINVSQKKPNLSFINNIVSSWEIKIFNPDPNYLSVEVGNIDIEYRNNHIIGKVLGKDLLSKKGLLQADLSFIIKKNMLNRNLSGATLKMRFPLKDISDINSIINNVDLISSVSMDAVTIPTKITEFSFSSFEGSIIFKNGLLKYNLKAVCPPGHSNQTKFVDGSIAVDGKGSISFDPKNQITANVSSNFTINYCDSPDYFRWSPRLSKHKMFKDNRWMPTNVQGTTSLVIDNISSLDELSAQGSFEFNNLVLLAPAKKQVDKNPFQKISIPTGRITFNFKDETLNFASEGELAQGEIGLQGKLNVGKLNPAIDARLKVNHIVFDSMKPFSRGDIYPTKGNLSADIEIIGSLNKIEDIVIDGFITGENLKLGVPGPNHELKHLDIRFKNMAQQEKVFKIDLAGLKFNKLSFSSLSGELRIFPNDFRISSNLLISTGTGKFNIQGNIDPKNNLHSINFFGKNIIVENIKKGYINGTAHFSGNLHGKLTPTGLPENQRELFRFLRKFKPKNVFPFLSGEANFSVSDGSIEHLIALKGEAPLGRHTKTQSFLIFNKLGGFNFSLLKGDLNISNGILKADNFSIVSPESLFSGKYQLNLVNKNISGHTKLLKTKGKDSGKSHDFILTGSLPSRDNHGSIDFTPKLN